MSKLFALIHDAKVGLSVQECIQDTRWDAIATDYGVPEVAEIKVRIAALKAELATVEQ